MDPALAAILRSWTFDPWLIAPVAVAARALRPRLVALALPDAAAFYGLAPGEFPGRSVSALPCPGIASREARCGVAAGPYDAASRAHDGGATTACMGGADTTAAARIATRSVETWAGITARLARVAVAATLPHPSRGGMVGLYDCHSCLACPCAL